jgi:hypothetical protein
MYHLGKIHVLQASFTEAAKIGKRYSTHTSSEKLSLVHYSYLVIALATMQGFSAMLCDCCEQVNTFMYYLHFCMSWIITVFPVNL